MHVSCIAGGDAEVGRELSGVKVLLLLLDCSLVEISALGEEAS